LPAANAPTSSNTVASTNTAGEKPAASKDVDPLHVAPLVERHLAARRGYQPGDLIARGDVEPILKEIETRTGRKAEIDQVRKQLLPDNALLVRELRTPAGQTFMRQSARFNQGYDRLDHLSQLPDGPTLLQRLIQGPDGYKLIEYLTSTPGGKVMGQQLSESPGGEKFNAATGRIYTAAELTAALKKFETPAPRGPASRKP
jgi:hypothetical protein